MKFLIDECVGSTVVLWLSQKDYDVVSVYSIMPSASDDEVMEKLLAERRILITCDKDFGEMVFRHFKLHYGIVLLRLEDERPANKIRVLENILTNYSHTIPNNFIVATETNIRISRSIVH